MKIGILLCDHMRPEFRGKFGDLQGVFWSALSRTGEPMELRYFPAVDGHLPGRVDSCDAWVCSGSRWCTNDDVPWVHNLTRFIRELYEAQKGLVGICFGHQLIAKALGGTVGRSAKGWGLGVMQSAIVAKQPWMVPSMDTARLVVHHQDQVTALPENAKVLMTNDFCKNSMIMISNHFVGLQGHPEFCRSYSAALINAQSDRLPARVRDAAFASLHSDVHDKAVLKWLVNFLKSTIS